MYPIDWLKAVTICTSLTFSQNGFADRVWLVISIVFLSLLGIPCLTWGSKGDLSINRLPCGFPGSRFGVLRSQMVSHIHPKKFLIQKDYHAIITKGNFLLLTS